VDSGERAVQLFEQYGARLVVLDINLPDVNGFDLGADDYIEKPYDIDIHGW